MNDHEHNNQNEVALADHAQPEPADHMAGPAPDHAAIATPPQQRWLAPHDIIRDWSLEETVDTAHETAESIERSWGLRTPGLQSSWEQTTGYQGLAEEVTTTWTSPDPSYVEVMISVNHNILRLLHILERGTVIRYITPQNVWAFTTNHDGSMTHIQEPEPTPIAKRPAFSIIAYSPTPQQHRHTQSSRLVYRHSSPTRQIYRQDIRSGSVTVPLGAVPQLEVTASK